MFDWIFGLLSDRAHNKKLEKQGKIDTSEVRMTQIRGMQRSTEQDVTVAKDSQSGENEYHRVVAKRTRKG